ncbi:MULTISPECIES: 3-carboxy-cis,cis-muconate cycloisomerase [unclassified Chelatococcus]|uniref:3-carboxy-cis,cis-muconate cycloisomerase n=1 Tax=unclassified Chelatococcus TaxID=2638111 RepID=UPI001BCAD687|nr:MULTISPECIES: 3-carboxy-cis,cis-muconate cycloisomerase [unclassified Chelatococcus]CAH1651804.1 3-carboxy-cis,cis-muconate cycloisomerase [Hyphomicrobiales bacterium]MBS7743118.1 3-carboxy-cis,cis-muconate cycloisomerase [Chelatococcus sp. HY11]MBX3541764.1 3-carboxy-cis,cis-muconate cycloisomerase [Chelatococcus sp.]MCO5074344.1 3-carboxy-cis,cis-muconate cycloisomerase [Chelatococcus sp.]CAH1693489.1 3-carboxy-cis,cis-muconate cycloisomerase [Hyphomicrobiales bacterium]
MPILASLVGDREIEGLLSDEAQLRAMLRFENALAGAEADAGLIPSEAAEAVAAAISAFQPDWDDLAKGVARDGVVVPALIKQIRAGLPSRFQNALHKGATSQDVIDTALILQFAEVLPVLEARLSIILDKLAAISRLHGAEPLMAHTRMQQALPFTWHEKLKTWSDPLGRHLVALAEARVSCLVIQLGGPIGDRSSFAGLGDAIARDLSHRLSLANASPWHAARDRIAKLGSLLSLISGSLGKIGADVALMTQNEMSAVRLSGGGGSSAMAHKSNPISAEILVTLARYNAGQTGLLHQALIHENERSGAAWTLEWMTLPAIAIATGAGLHHLISLLDQLVIDSAG